MHCQSPGRESELRCSRRPWLSWLPALLPSPNHWSSPPDLMPLGRFLPPSSRVTTCALPKSAPHLWHSEGISRRVSLVRPIRIHAWEGITGGVINFYVHRSPWSSDRAVSNDSNVTSDSGVAIRRVVGLDRLCTQEYYGYEAVVVGVCAIIRSPNVAEYIIWHISSIFRNRPQGSAHFRIRSSGRRHSPNLPLKLWKLHWGQIRSPGRMGACSFWR